MMRVLGCIFNQGSFTAPKVDMSDKTIVVTGPSIGGIGFETALGLAVSCSEDVSGICNFLSRGPQALFTFQVEEVKNFAASSTVSTVYQVGVVVFTLKAVPVSTQYFLTSVLVQLTRTPSVVTG